MAKTVNGRERIWQIQELVGSGDAGEVLRVVSQSGNLQGVMKRPLQTVSGGTIVRQAVQIETEGKILAALDGVDFSKNGLTIHTPRLLDQSIAGTSRTVNLFIVSEEIPGKSISALLADRISTGQVIPQDVVLKVLSSLLILLDKVHSKGVVWNDVKMEHIYWEARTKTMSFIDWGNGLFLQPQAELEKSPIWQDYTQLIEEGLNLLNQTSPHLIYDLGWPLHASEFKPEDIPQLRLRVEYLESYLTMRAIEYELLFERFTSSMPNLEALDQALDLNQKLNQFGIGTDLTRLFAAAEELLFRLLAENGFEKIEKLVNLLETALEEAITPQWRLAIFLLKLKEDIPLNGLTDLLKKVFASDWTEAAWQARTLIEAGHASKELGSAIYAMRSQYLNSSTLPTIYHDMHALITLLDEQLQILNGKAMATTNFTQQLSLLKEKLQSVFSRWPQLEPDEMLGNQLFDLRQIISKANSMRLRLPQGLSERLQNALTIARDLYHSWTALDFYGALTALKKLYTTEPTLDYLLPLAASLEKVKANIEDFKSGPAPEQSVNAFASELLTRADDLSSHLGKPAWWEHFAHALRAMSQAVNLEDLQDLARQNNWPTDWVYQPGLKLNLPYDKFAQSVLDETQKEALRAFHLQIRNSYSSAEQLVSLRRLLPAWYGSYKELDEEFHFIFSTIPRETNRLTAQNFPLQDVIAVSQALEILDQTTKWQSAAQVGDWYLLKTMAESFDSTWALLDNLQSASELWLGEVLPALTDIKQPNWKSTGYKKLLQPKLPALTQTQGHLYTFICEWQKIEFQGLYPQLLSELVYQSDASQKSFFKAWQQLSRSESGALAWLTQNQQSIFSEINQTLLTLYRSLRDMQRNFEVINQPEMARTRLARNAAGDLMFLLIKTDETVNPTKKTSSVFKRWQRQYLNLLSSTDSAKIRQGIQEVEGIHPLLPWFDELVRRDAGYFEPGDAYQW